MNTRRPLWAVLLAYLIPQPVLAFESGVNAMQAVQDAENKHSLTAWAYQEFTSIITGARAILEPILPPVIMGFSSLDAQIAAFIAEGKAEQTRIGELISATEQPQDPQPTPVPDQTMIVEAQQTTPILFYGSMDSPEYIPSVEIFNENGDLLNIDTSKGIDLPDVTIDPRDGGTYESEIAALEPVLDIVQMLQDQVPDAIQTAGNSLYDQLTGTNNDARSPTGPY